MYFYGCSFLKISLYVVCRLSCSQLLNCGGLSAVCLFKNKKRQTRTSFFYFSVLFIFSGWLWLDYLRQLLEGTSHRLRYGRLVNKSNEFKHFDRQSRFLFIGYLFDLKSDHVISFRELYILGSQLVIKSRSISYQSRW